MIFLDGIWSMKSKVRRVRTFVIEVIIVVDCHYIIRELQSSNVCFNFTCSEMSAYPLRVQLSSYPVYVHLLCFRFIHGSLCKRYDTGCFYA